MPNKRAKNKVLLGAFVDVGLKAALVNAASARGITTSGAVKEAIAEYIRHNNKVINGSACEVGNVEEQDSQLEVGSGKESRPGLDSSLDEVWLL